MEGIVSSVIADVQKRGNAAVFEYTQRFNGLKLTAKALFVSQTEIDEAYSLVDDDVKKAVATSKRNIHAFVKRNMRKNWKAKNREGVEVGERFTPNARYHTPIGHGRNQRTEIGLKMQNLRWLVSKSYAA